MCPMFATLLEREAPLDSLKNGVYDILQMPSLFSVYQITRETVHLRSKSCGLFGLFVWRVKFDCCSLVALVRLEIGTHLIIK